MTNRPFYLILLGGLLFFLALVFLVGEKPTEEGATDQPPVEEVAFDPAAQYAQSCAMCHGANLEGTSAPSLIGLTLTPEEIADIALNGIRTMPPNMFKGSEEERLALANWILEHK